MFDDTSVAIRIAKASGSRLKRLSHQIQPDGFDGRRVPELIHMLTASISIDRREFEDTPMVLTKLERHDLIIG